MTFEAFPNRLVQRRAGVGEGIHALYLIRYTLQKFVPRRDTKVLLEVLIPGDQIIVRKLVGRTLLFYLRPGKGRGLPALRSGSGLRQAGPGKKHNPGARAKQAGN